MADWTPIQALVTAALGGIGLLGGYTAWIHGQISQERMTQKTENDNLWLAVQGLRNDSTILERRLSDKMDDLATKEDLLAMENRLMKMLRIGEGD